MKQSMPESLSFDRVSDEDGPLINNNVIRIQLREPRHRKWELCTRNCSPGRVFPTIQLFDCEGNLLVETNDDNLSIKSSDFEKSLSRRHSKSLGASDFAKKQINFPLKKNNSISGDRTYTRLYKRTGSKEEEISLGETFDAIETDSSFQNDKEKLRIPLSYRRSVSSPLSLYSSAFDSSEFENSSYKSSDNESYVPNKSYRFVAGKAGTLLLCDTNNGRYPNRRRRPLTRRSTDCDSTKYTVDFEASEDQKANISDCSTHYGNITLYNYNGKPVSPKSSVYREYSKINGRSYPRRVTKSASYHKPKCKQYGNVVRRANTEIIPATRNEYFPLNGKKVIRNMSFLDIYVKSLPTSKKETPAWLDEVCNNVQLREKSKNCVNENWRKGMVITDDSTYTIDVEKCHEDKVLDRAVEQEIKRRLRKYQKVLSCSDYWTWKKDSAACQEPEKTCQQTYSDGGDSSSSESLDEADKVLMRLRRRIFQNRRREKKCREDPVRRRTYSSNLPTQASRPVSHIARTASLGCGSSPGLARPSAPGGWAGLRGHGVRRPRPAMGASSSRHKGLGGRRAQSSGDLCAGVVETRAQDTCSRAGSAAGDAAPWNSRSLPSHLDGRRRCPSSSSYCPPAGGSCGRGSLGGRHHRKYSHHLGCKSVPDLDPVWKLQDPGCDQGYGSERSPEEECPPVMPSEEDFEDPEMDIRQMYPFINDENTFTVRVEKDRRGLGLSVAGGAGSGGSGPGLVRIRRLYAAQPAWSTGRLRPGDLLLAANGISLAGLTTYEALEVLRTTPPIVELVVCRPEPEMLDCLTPPGGPPEPPLRQPPPDPLNLHPPRTRAPPPPSPAPTNAPEYEEPQPVYDVKFGEFDILMTKVNGSLGFTLRKEDHSALGHYVRALVREPALSDGRIQPGDRIVAVNDVPMSTLSHGEAVSFLRRCGPMARLRLYRDHCGTPPSPSAASPTTESDTTLVTRPKPPLRQEAVNMLSDIAARKLTPDDGNGSRSPCASPRRYKKLTRNSTGYSQNSVAAHGYELNNLDNDVLDAPNIYQDISQNGGSAYLSVNQNLQLSSEMSNEPISMPIELISSAEASESRFSHKNPVYQSAQVHPSANSNPGLSESNKEEENERKFKSEKSFIKEEPEKPTIVQYPDENRPPGNCEPRILTVELNRGWNSRLGFSVQCHPESGQSFISAIYSDSVAAKDGRLRQGDIILQVNDENITSMTTPEVIDLLRILRGSICITVLRQ